MIMIEKEGADIDHVPAQRKDLGTNRGHPLLPVLVVKGNTAVFLLPFNLIFPLKELLFYYFLSRVLLLL